jgi:hypothetical protein
MRRRVLRFVGLVLGTLIVRFLPRLAKGIKDSTS